MTLSGFLPDDSRLSELSSGWALILLGLLVLWDSNRTFGAVNIEGLLQVQVQHFWVVVLTCLGALQVFSVVVHPRTEVLRVIMSWVAGTAWVWISLASNVGHINPPDPAALTMGFANLYAFVVNALMLRRTWTS